MPRYVTAGPGPAAYKLPSLIGRQNHDCSKFCSPAYSMGLKTSSTLSSVGPGPKYNLTDLTTYGKATPPMFSMKSRHPELFKHRTPGPGAYKPELVKPMNSKRAPCYSMFSRYPPIRADPTPAPNNYELPTTVGPKVPDKHATAAYSMSFRHTIQVDQQSPGPAAYASCSSNLHRQKWPSYSMATRAYPPLGQASGPGPIYKPKFPEKSGYSFGLRTDTDPYVTAEDFMPCMFEPDD
ncbi:outer dense fiber protein 3 [Aethina tumida]|uniref:outer dense fiber protein 3 n=1 Tax=Aethina tumida TaxID=116153 RepID=UPI00096AEF00|nr:outer dense fiber protein 3 [Aethina tumida]